MLFLLLLALVAHCSLAFNFNPSSWQAAPQISRQDWLSSIGGGLAVAGWGLAGLSQPSHADDVKSISYREFQEALLANRVSNVRFLDNYSRCIVQISGEAFVIGEGYPKESPVDNETPMKVVAQVRNAGVPYKVEGYNLSGYAKQKSYSSKETMEALKRQQIEDEKIAAFTYDE